MNVLITGGCGHIGSFLIRNMSKNYNIKVVDNFLTQRYCSLFNIDRNITNIEFSDESIDDIEVNYLDNIDTVIHLAAYTDASTSFKKRELVESINVESTKVFIEKCLNSNVSTFVFPSSTSVYGVSADVVYEDNPNHVNPQSPYAETKINIEEFIKTQFRYESKYLILRFGTIFGYSIGMRFHTAINKFCYQAAMNKPLTIWKENYEQVRPYLGLSDAKRSILHLIEKKNLLNETYNVISGNFKLRDIVEIITKCFDNVDINMIETPLLNQFSYNVSDQKIRNTGYISKDSLEMEIEKTRDVLLYKSVPFRW